jgi:hypothetical protein
MNDVTNLSQNPAAFRRKAGEFRRYAEGANDQVVHDELLRLATLYERMAVRGEGQPGH